MNEKEKEQERKELAVRRRPYCSPTALTETGLVLCNPRMMSF